MESDVLGIKTMDYNSDLIQFFDIFLGTKENRKSRMDNIKKKRKAKQKAK